MRSVACLCVWLALLATEPVRAVEVDARFKWFGTLGVLPEEDVQRQRSGTPSFDDNFDLRLKLRQRTGKLTLLADHSTTLLRNDGPNFAGAGNTLDQTAVSDDRRLMDLTWNLDRGDNHRLLHRLDRLALQYRDGPWAVTLGRQAVSWGNGLVFQPMDLFNPFAPTAVDQDYKIGDDIVRLQRSLDGGGSIQLLAVARRDADEDVTAASGSVAGKWHSFVGSGELQLMAGRHYEDHVAAAAWRMPLGGALLRSDLVATRLDSGTWKLSGIVNVDYSLLAGQRNVYLFAEYFHNAFGVRRLPETLAGYPETLIERLGRGELFNLMRDYIAVGGTLEWHPLWSQSLTLIGNLHDASALVHMQISHEPDDHQRLELGVVHPLGRAGDEFGGVPVATRAVTAGGATRIYLRWAYYF